ncbi:MAG TPA: response regulator [Myxococcales bacterium]
MLCDVGLPGMNGYAVARAIRAEPSLRGTCLVAVTGYAQAEDVQRAAEAGFDKHVAKPPSVEETEKLLAAPPGSSRPLHSRGASERASRLCISICRRPRRAGSGPSPSDRRARRAPLSRAPGRAPRPKAVRRARRPGFRRDGARPRQGETPERLEPWPE